MLKINLIFCGYCIHKISMNCKVSQFVFDLELPKSFTPTNNDGEVNEFLLVPVAQLIDMICNFDVALSATPKIMDFLIRKGFLTFEIGM